MYATANQTSPDGGLDADGDILLNGGYVVAAGVRSDAVSDDSAQQFIQLDFAALLPAGSQIQLSDGDGAALLSFSLEKSAQSIVFSSPDLKQDVDYALTVDGVAQQYTGTSSGGMGPGSGGQPPEKPDGSQTPGDSAQQPPEKPDGDDRQDDRPQPPENGGQAPDGQAPGTQPGEPQDGQTEPSTQFTLTDDRRIFSGICNSTENG